MDNHLFVIYTSLYLTCNICNSIVKVATQEDNLTQFGIRYLKIGSSHTTDM
jgi:hypothetical protein